MKEPNKDNLERPRRGPGEWQREDITRMNTASTCLCTMILGLTLSRCDKETGR